MKTILVTGTFDGLHEGHINFFKQAKDWEDEVTQANKDIEEFGFTKTLLEKETPTLF